VGDVESLHAYGIDVAQLVDAQRLDRDRIDVVQFLDVDRRGGDSRDSRDLDIGELRDAQLGYRLYVNITHEILFLDPRGETAS
jgi:hypothetical protein